MPKILKDTLAQEKEETQKPPGFGEKMKEAYELRAANDGIDWSPANVAEFIVNCRSDCRGVPMFRPEFAGEQLTVNGESAVLLNCWLGTDGCKGQFFTDVPGTAIQEMKTRSGEWKHFLQKWDESGQLPQSVRTKIGSALSSEIVF